MSKFDWDVGVVSFSEYNADGFLGVRPDVYGEEKSGCPTLEQHSPFGFLSRPLDPDVDGDGAPVLGCNTLYAWEGNRGHAWLGSDPRVVSKLPQVQKGESFMYGGAGQFIRCHTDGSISMFTTDDATPDGRSIYFKMSPTKGFEWSCPWGRMQFGPNGFRITHSSGASFGLGAIGAPAPLDALGSYVKMTAAMASIQSGAVSLGTDGGGANLAATTALSAVLTDVAACIASLAADMATATGAGHSAAAAITALTAALTTLQTAMPGLGKVV